MSSPTILVNLKDLSPTKDGSLVIYNRPTADGGLNPVYQVKIKLPNQKRIRLSTKTKDVNEANRTYRSTHHRSSSLGGHLFCDDRVTTRTRNIDSGNGAYPIDYPNRT